MLMMAVGLMLLPVAYSHAANDTAGVGCVQQGKTVEGVVVDTNGDPIIGATIKVKNSNAATVTDMDGRFVVSNVPDNAVITVSFIGYQSQTVSARDGKRIRIVLKDDAAALDEIVVVGYGYVKKSDLTGSVGQLKGGDIMKNSPVSMEQGIQGRLSGVNVVSNDGAPGGGISIQIRGTNTFQGSTEPLYVIDGVPIADSNDDTINFESETASYNNVLSSLNPNDIASVEILKDASATAIYGSRGANGVVLITTKSGEGLNMKDKVTVSYKTSFSNPVKKIKVLGARDYAAYRNMSYINTQEVSKFEWQQINLPFPGMENSEGEYKKGPEDFGNDPYYWQDQIFRTGVTNDLNASITGQAMGMDYALSAGYTDQTGIVKGSDYTRYTLKLNLNKQVKPWLKLGTSISGTFANSSIIKAATSNKNNGTEGVIRSALTFPANYFIDELDEEYSMVALPSRYVEALNKNRNMSFRSSSYVNVNLIKGLMFRTVVGYNYTTNNANKYWPSDLAEGKTVKGRSYAGDNWRTSLVYDNLLMFNETWASTM